MKKLIEFLQDLEDGKKYIGKNETYFIEERKLVSTSGEKASRCYNSVNDFLYLLDENLLQEIKEIEYEWQYLVSTNGDENFNEVTIHRTNKIHLDNINPYYTYEKIESTKRVKK